MKFSPFETLSLGLFLKPFSNFASNFSLVSTKHILIQKQEPIIDRLLTKEKKNHRTTLVKNWTGMPSRILRWSDHLDIYTIKWFFLLLKYRKKYRNCHVDSPQVACDRSGLSDDRKYVYGRRLACKGCFMVLRRPLPFQRVNLFNYL